MNKEFAISVCRRLLNVWAATFELEITSLGFPSETSVEFSVCSPDRLPAFAISHLDLFLGSGITVKTVISHKGTVATITVEDYQYGSIADLWKLHESYFGR